jgi:tetratricopeptide (TPR) repeat protein
MLAWGMGNAPAKTIFISRAGADKELAIRIAKVLRGAGHEVILQDETFGHQGFLSRMNDALETGARVIALLSPDYLRSDNCAAEWQGAIKGDPLNRKQRLILFRACVCQPPALISQIPYVDLMDVNDDPVRLAATVLNAVARGAAVPDSAPGTLVDPDAVWEVPSFTGRGEALEELHKALFAEGGMAAVTAVHGTGGMGKSALAREYARRHRQDYSILWWLNAETEDGIIGGLIRLGTRFIPGLDQAKDRTEAAKLALERVFAPLHKPALLVFDNVEKQDLLRKWKPHENCHVLVTSRLHGWGGGFHPVEIKEWPPEDARAYLLRESARADLKEADADEIAKTLGHLPLALAHTAAVLRDNPAMTAKSYLTRIETLLDRAPEGAEYGKAVYATFQEALAQAEKRAPGAAAILCLAAFYAPDDIPFELFEQDSAIYPDELAPVFDDGTETVMLRVALADPVAWEKSLSALGRASLIALSLQAREFSVHRLVQSACRDLVGRSALAKASWLWAAVVAIDRLVPDAKFENWRLLARLAPQVEALAAFLPDMPQFRLARMFNEAGRYLHERGEFGRAEILYLRALAIDEAQLALPERSNREEVLQAAGVHSVNFGRLLQFTKRLDQAESRFRDALRMTEEGLGTKHPNVASCLLNLANVLRDKERKDEAELTLQKALEIFETEYKGDHLNIGVCLSSMASLKRAAGRPEEAVVLYERTLTICKKYLEPNDPDMARATYNLGGALAECGRSAEALTLIELAAENFVASLGAAHPLTQAVLSSSVHCRLRLVAGSEEKFNWIQAGGDSRARKALDESLRLYPSKLWNDLSNRS